MTMVAHHGRICIRKKKKNEEGLEFPDEGASNFTRRIAFEWGYFTVGTRR